MRLLMMPLVTAAAAAFQLPACAAGPMGVNGNCPSKANGHRWRDYFLGKYIGGGVPLRGAGVDFSAAQHMSDKTSLRGIDPTSCYRVYFLGDHDRPPHGWGSFRYGRSDHYAPGIGPSDADFREVMTDLQQMEAQPGDPQQGIISISGTKLHFNNLSGILKDSRGRKVGQLQCFWRMKPVCP